MKRVCLLICLLVLVGGCATKQKEDNGGTFVEETNLELTGIENCNNKVTEYYTHENQKIYFVCLEEVRIPKENCTLSYYFNQANKSWEDKLKDLISSLRFNDELNDGGTKIYKNDTSTIITCHKTLHNDKYNEDIYIGNENLEYNEEYCTREY